MAQVKALTVRKIEATKTPARLADGRGLYLIVKNETSKHWVFEYQFKGKRRYMGLGSALDVPLARARELRDEYRALKATGVDPLSHKRATQAAEALDAAKAVTFEQAATRYIAANRAGWQNAGHALQWDSTLKTYVFPLIGHLPVGSIDTALVVTVLEPIWVSRTETATRVRGRIELVLDWAKALKYREGENPARWRGHLDKLLPAPKKVRTKKNFPAMPWADVPAFLKDLRSIDSVPAAALDFLILTAARKNEVVDARWDEIDLQNAIWTVPAERMKKRIEHRVPLSKAAIEILERMPRINEFVFHAIIRGTKRISDATLGRLMDDMGRADFVPHGFRSSFRDWAGESTSVAREVIEKALAHSVGDESERSYARGDLFEKRRKLMDDWAAFATSDPVRVGDNVVELRSTAI
jgi:integrase